MNEQESREYLQSNPEAIVDVDLAHELAIASDEFEETLKIFTGLALEAAAEGNKEEVGRHLERLEVTKKQLEERLNLIIDTKRRIKEIINPNEAQISEDE